MTPHDKAIKGLFEDMDDMESKRIFQPSENKQMSITITLNPNQSEEDQNPMEGANGDTTELPADDHDESMCKGGCAMHSGGIAGEEMDFSPTEDGEDLALPKFLRKKKK